VKQRGELIHGVKPDDGLSIGPGMTLPPMDSAASAGPRPCLTEKKGLACANPFSFRPGFKR
jgi:hypothetical protein